MATTIQNHYVLQVLPTNKNFRVGGWENDSLTKSYLDQNSEEGTDRVNFMMTILIIPASVEAWRS